MATHQVTNQPPPLGGRNLFLDNIPLAEALEREGGGWATGRAEEVGSFWGGEPMEWFHEVFRRDGTLYNRLTEGGYFGEAGLLQKKRVRFPVVALQDTLPLLEQLATNR